ncbi:unnamed protein product [Brachionus calyciflorus]|uniref:Arrestin C-terminal-like domain-containing protein n=1 Tax=Brachionus calyciflorus TaxID=104777 RepID=A0A813PQD5_9BILA|nr:unnamed protein product [Brachionus calyciflorus]
MEKIEKFSIYLNKPNFTYLPGEHVTGIVRFRLNEASSVNVIKINLNGGAIVNWTEEDTDSDGNKQSNSYSVDETYINKDIILATQKNSNKLYLEINEYDFPFDFVLPNYLPYSIYDSNGQIYYLLTALIDIPWSSNIKTKLRINIAHSFDLNSNPSLRHGYEVETLCCGPSKSNPILIKISTLKCGYVPGERINFSILLKNFGSRKIDLIEVKFDKCYFYVNSKTNWSINISKIMLAGSIRSGEKKAWNNLELLIPNILSTLPGHIIQIKYFLIFSIKTSCLTFTKEVKIPIVIGTIPFNNSNPPIVSYPSLESSPPPYNQISNYPKC